MSSVNVVQKTQRLIVEPASKTVSVINAGPIGPGVGGGPGTSGVTDTDLAAAVSAIEDLISQAMPSGFIGATFATSEPPGWFFDDKTITDCETLYPSLWANTPASWRSGSDLLIPDLTNRVIMFSTGLTGILAGSNSRAIGTNNLPAHNHAVGTLSTGTTGGTHTHTTSVGIESRGHVHYTSGTKGGWTASATIATDAHSHTLSNPGNYSRGWMYSKGSYTGTGISSTAAAANTNNEWYYKDYPGTSGDTHGHSISGYVTGAHQTHTHSVTVNSTNSGHGHTLSGSTANNTTTATALDTTPAHVTARPIIKI